MDQGNAAVIAGVIGAIAGVFGGVTIMLIQKNYEQKKWNREKLIDVYSNCIYYLIKFSISSITIPIADKDIRQHFSEVQRNLIVLRCFMYDEEAFKKLQAHSANLKTHWNNSGTPPNYKALSDEADDVVETVKSIMEEDKRLRYMKLRSLDELLGDN